MNISQIQENLKKVLGDLNRDEFIYELLNAYGKPKASISRLKNGTYNLSKNANEVLWKKEVLFVRKVQDNLHTVIDEIRKSDLISKHKPRFLIVTNFELFLAIDTKTNETLDVSFADLDKSFDFFLPWAGMEKAQRQNENPADVKAAEKMAKLYDEILKDNPAKTKDEIHNLNVFLTRLLFCLFAEDTEIFTLNCFTNLIISHTQDDGSDLDVHFKKLFHLLSDPNRDGVPEYLKVFPYVNGGLFTEEISAPKFTRRSRLMIIESGELDWSSINPDIFGSMFQAVVHTEQRAEMGMHYTSVPNIMKVIEPLFLDELNDAFNKNYDSENKLEQLLVRLENIKIFDPACGSGNFLIIAYKEIRILEMKILSRIREISKNKSLRFSNINLSQFFGIELDDFAHEIAILSLWLVEHQMNISFREVFGSYKPSLPLKNGGAILCENATRVNWLSFCPKTEKAEVFILGNPPYQGAKKQTIPQKEDMAFIFAPSTSYKNLDYICCWFLLASKYIAGSNSKFSFVSTNSITQGDQVGLFWNYILENNQEIFFAHKTFKWVNNAKKNAGVDCVVIGVSEVKAQSKWIYSDGVKNSVSNISPYLAETSNLIINKRKSSLSKLPEMVYGNMPLEGGFLKLNAEEKKDLETKYSKATEFIRPLIGGDEFLKGTQRWCLWIEDTELDQALKIPEIAGRIDQVKSFRKDGGEVARTLINKSHQFRYRHEAKSSSIIVPCTSSGSREYMQCGYFSPKYIALNSAQVIYDAEPYVFGIISSKMHMAWIRAVGGRLKSDYRYSSAIVYNTFPFPEISASQKERITACVMRVLSEREIFSEMTIGELYDKNKMPHSLKLAHIDLDLVVDQCYRSKPFISDEERLEYLYGLYEEMTENEKSQ